MIRNIQTPKSKRPSNVDYYGLTRSVPYIKPGAETRRETYLVVCEVLKYGKISTDY